MAKRIDHRFLAGAGETRVVVSSDDLRWCAFLRKWLPPDVGTCRSGPRADLHIKISVGAGRPSGRPWAREQAPEAAFRSVDHGNLVRLEYPGTPQEQPALALDFIGQLKSELVAHFTRRGWTACHAAAAEINGRLAVFIGGSGFGKSTLCVLLASRGHAVADELVLFRSLPGRIEALAPMLPLSVTRGTLRLVPPAEQWRLGHPVFSHGKVLLKPLWTVPAAASVSAVFLLERERPEAGCVIRTAGRAQAARRLLGNTVRHAHAGRAFSASRKRTWRCLCAMLGLLPIYTLSANLARGAEETLDCVEGILQRRPACLCAAP